MKRSMLLGLVMFAGVAGAVPSFDGADIAVVGKPYRLTLPPGSHEVTWGDGGVETVSKGEAVHVYRKPGVAGIRVRSKGAAIMRDYAGMVERSSPVIFLDEVTGAPGPAAHLPAAVVLEAGKTYDAGRTGVTSADSFSVEAWLKWEGSPGPATLLSTGEKGCRVVLEKDAVVFEQASQAAVRSGGGLSLGDGQWHHVAVTYDRVPLFPRSNRVRFYVDGKPAGEGRIDAVDAGAVACAQVSLGGEGFKGQVAGLAVYGDLLFPLDIHEHAAAVESGDVLQATVAEGGSAPVKVDEPVISKTVEVSLDPAPDADNGPALREAIKQAEKGTRLRIVSKDGGKRGGTYAIRTLLEAPKWTSVLVEGKTDFELDGNGATLVFSNKVARYLYVQNCERVAIRNLSMDLDPAYARVGMYAKIVEADPATGEVKAVVVNGRDQKPVTSLPSRASYWRWRPHDPETLRIAKTGPYFDSGSYARKPQPDAAAGPGVIRFKLKQGPGDELWKKIAAYQKEGSFYLINNADFSSNAVSLDGGGHITFERVNYYAVMGMVFLSADVANVRVARCKIGLPPGLSAADRPLSAGSDGYHFHLTRGSILFEENEVALTDDDPVSFKDSVFTKVERVDGRKLKVEGGGIKKEQPIELLDAAFKSTGYKAKVVAVEGEVLTLDKELPKSIEPRSVVMNRSHHTANWIMRGNYLHDYYGRVMLYTDSGTVFGNRVHKSYYHLGISDAYFERAGVSGRVITHRNLFEDTTADASFWGGKPVRPSFHGISYSANSFVGEGLSLNHAQAPLVVRNWFQREGGGEVSPVSLVNCPEALVAGNVVALSKPGLLKLKATDSPGLRETDNRVLAGDSSGTKP